MSGRTKAPEWERNDQRPRAILVGLDSGSLEWPIEESLAELERLADTLGHEVVAVTSQKLDRPHPQTFIGPGKVEEVRGIAESVSADFVIFDDQLSPRQEANLTDRIPGRRILDRTALILNIFAIHAVSREGKIQVELAQLEYMLPRLRGMWSHLVDERLGGGRGTRFGAGESQLETDRRLARKRISVLKRELRQVAITRNTQRQSRNRSGILRAALVGYTNAGKSSLLNSLTGSDVLAHDQLFATLDSTSRQLTLCDGQKLVLTDTVGFINKLPHELVEAFKSTLDEVSEADLLLHVIDGSHHQAQAQAAAVMKVLHEIGADQIPALDVYSKVDLITEEALQTLRSKHPDSLFVSNVNRSGLEDLMAEISETINAASRKMKVLLPYTRGDLVQLAREQAHIVSEEHTANGTCLVVLVPPRLINRFQPFLVSVHSG